MFFKIALTAWLLVVLLISVIKNSGKFDKHPNLSICIIILFIIIAFIAIVSTIIVIWI